MVNLAEPIPVRERVRLIGLMLGPLAAALCYVSLPDQFTATEGALRAFSPAGKATLAMLVWMAIWWTTEAIAIEATALLPIVAFPLLGVASLADTAAPYGSEVVFLFLGGFVLAAGLARWGLDRRVALFVLGFVGTRPSSIVAAMMVTTALLSMWVSNTATAAMMVPIAMSIVALVPAAARSARTGRIGSGAAALDHMASSERNFAVALLLAIAYSASIGGLGTIIGSPPNGIAVRFIEQTYAREISFVGWMAVGMPIVAMLLPAAWILLTQILFRTGSLRIAGGAAFIASERARLGAIGGGERVTLVVFVTAALLWMVRPLLADVTLGGMKPFAGWRDAGIAVGAALALFIIPVDFRRGIHAMDWDSAKRIPWGVLVLFGGGLALADAVQANGVTAFIASFANQIAGWPLLAVVIVIVAISVFLSELTSNTAQVATMIPVLAAIAPVLGADPTTLILACTVGASCAFMLPVGTPPNAIVFGSGWITIPTMCRAGLWLNMIAIVIITLLAYQYLPFVLQLR